MFRRLFAILFALFAAVIGAVLGRLAADLRRRSEAGEELRLELDIGAMKPRDVMPGLVAALRVRDRPWSYLHIPSWLAAFSVNFAFVALARELGPLLGALRGDSDGDERMERADTYGWEEPRPSAPAGPAEAEFRPL